MKKEIWCLCPGKSLKTDLITTDNWRAQSSGKSSLTYHDFDIGFCRKINRQKCCNDKAGTLINKNIQKIEKYTLAY